MWRGESTGYSRQCQNRMISAVAYFSSVFSFAGIGIPAKAKTVNIVIGRATAQLHPASFQPYILPVLPRMRCTRSCLSRRRIRLTVAVTTVVIFNRRSTGRCRCKQLIWTSRHKVSGSAFMPHVDGNIVTQTPLDHNYPGPYGSRKAIQLTETVG